jgi:hypothetical protein
MLIVYGATAGVSVVQLYAGAFFPGLMLAGLYIVYVIVLAKLQAQPDAAAVEPRSASCRCLRSRRARVAGGVQHGAAGAAGRAERAAQPGGSHAPTCWSSWAWRCCRWSSSRSWRHGAGT